MRNHSTARTDRRLWSWMLAALVAVGTSGDLRAEDGGTAAEDAPAAAVRLFNEGRQALKDGQLAEACSKFAESVRLDARVGTLLNLALCHEKRAMLVQATKYWRQAEQLAERIGDERAAVAREHAAKMDPKVPRLTITLAAGAPTGVVVTWTDSFSRGPKTLGKEALGKPLRVNAGSVRITVEAPGRESRSFTLAVALHDRRSVEVDAGPVAPEPNATGKPDHSASPADSGDSDASLPVTIAGFALGGLGLVGLGVGAVSGGIAATKQNESNEVDTATNLAPCDENDMCDQNGLALRDDAIAAATVSTAGVVVGSALLATGVVLVLVGQSGDGEVAGADESAMFDLVVSPSGGSLRLRW